MGKLTPELKKAITLQFPGHTVIEVRGEVVHFKNTKENWQSICKGLQYELISIDNDDDNTFGLYNPNNFSKLTIDGKKFLVCISDDNLEMPINYLNCDYMFYNFKFSNPAALKNFDTSLVKSMNRMFAGCTMPAGFTLGENFNTSCVESMIGMFKYCTFPAGFSFGDKFSTNNVINMHAMFQGAKLCKGFKLPDKFTINKVEDPHFMFKGCQMNSDFSTPFPIEELKGKGVEVF